ncbi:putative J domain-containing protein C63.13 [Lasiodiplodia hormozganensis]|uniref:J domain-containing protein C63.13 n=1 Tax=Lasiodiplodia hormozganensis TaxID=869390 RepID=A0AA39YX02_9PEZI|nr:putative J domain-containing protein C63.13 [Lasiodiplodia hormozganensis]
MSTPDYYKILDISPKATQQQIRDAYKKAALKHHPDRVPADSPERASRTRRFQQINDAYYTLCDPTRRRDYDAARTYNNYTGGFDDSEPEEEIPRPQAGQEGTMPGGFPWSSFFGGGASSSDNNGGASAANEHERFSNEQFGSVFEEMLREEGLAEGEQAQPNGKFWSLVGGLSGGAMGFIIANFPGAVAGAVAGNRLGAVRDARGKSVYAVFQELPQADKARMLSDLASKVFAHAVSA